MSPRNLTTLAALVSVLGLSLSVAGAQTVVHVDDAAALGGDGTSWQTAYMYLQDALIGAAGGTEIRVAQGTHKPDQDEAGNVTPGDREATFQLISRTYRWAEPALPRWVSCDRYLEFSKKGKE